MSPNMEYNFGVNNDKSVDVAYLHLQKASDKVPQRLLQKTKVDCVGGNALVVCADDLLSNRKKKVGINGPYFK